jgi:hypothetical protein
MGMVMELTLFEIERVDWPAFEALGADGEQVAAGLRALAGAHGAEDAEAAYWRLENHVVAQEDVYPIAEPTMGVLLAALSEDPPAFVKTWVYQLLFLILHGYPADSVRAAEHLIHTIKMRAREGYWLFVRDAVMEGREDAYAVLELLNSDERLPAVSRWMASRKVSP